MIDGRRVHFYKLTFDSRIPRAETIASVEEFKIFLKKSLNYAKYAHKITKASQSAIYSLKYKPHPYKVGEKLWISKGVFTVSYAKSQA